MCEQQASVGQLLSAKLCHLLTFAVGSQDQEEDAAASNEAENNLANLYRELYDPPIIFAAKIAS